MIIFKYHIGSNNLNLILSLTIGIRNIFIYTLICKLMESNEDMIRYANRDRQMKSRSQSHTPMDVDTDPFSFDQMRDQLDGIQQDNSNY